MLTSNMCAVLLYFIPLFFCDVIRYPVIGGPARVVTMKGTKIELGKGFDHSGCAKAIFEEGLNTGKGKIVRIICIDRVLTRIFW